tara:strand:- start:10955 stop:14185 length:3231 start_codon:yes stop_codon:yes gene_type:complete
VPLPISSTPILTFTATSDGATLTGTGFADRLIGYGKPGSGSGTLIGGLGDDTYVVHSQKHRIIETAGAGIDTVLSDWGYTLGDNLENLTLTGTSTNSAIGNGLDNIIIGNANKNVIDGGLGNDELSGGAGNDLFFVAGHDTITDFTRGDRLNLQAYGQFTSFAQVQAALSKVGTDTLLTLSATDSVRLTGVSANTLTADSFVLKNQISSYRPAFADNFDSFKLNLGTGSTDNWYPLFPRTGLAGHTTVDHGSVQYFTYPEDTGTYGKPVGINPFSLDKGVLTITMDVVPEADRSKIYGYAYSSGNLASIGSFHQTYGYFEIRAQLAAGQGVHDAFWLLPMDGSWPPELDIVEQRGLDPTHVINGVHANDTTSSSTFLVTTATTQFHTYGLDWEPDYLTWYIDGVAVRTMPTPAGLDKPMYMLANLGGGSPWAGKPDATTPFPVHMQIDYIKAYASANTVEKGVPVDKVGTSGNDILYGTSLGDTLNGGAGNDKIYAGAGNDTLSGGGGNDLLDGGFGDDTYIIISSSDTISEGGEKGNDVIKTALAQYTLPLNTEVLIYTGTGVFNGAGNIEDNVIQGGNAGGTLSGGDGNDVLHGGAGADFLNGGEGNDTAHGYGGADSLRGNAGDDVLYGEAGADLLKGDDGNDVIDGGDGDDNLQGGLGLDRLSGGAGSDKLDGGAEADLMSGGAGDDTYTVDDAGDVVTEQLNEGVDLVRTTLANFLLTANVENLVYTGTGSFVGTGNALANRISGGALSDTLDGGAGADILTGSGGDDIFVFKAGEANGDRVVDFTGAGVAGGDVLKFVGYAADASIAPGAIGGEYRITSNGVTETIKLDGVKLLSPSDFSFVSSPQQSTIYTDQLSYKLPDGALNLVFAGTGNFSGTGNALANMLTGDKGADRLDGLGGADVLKGGAGNDTYIVDNAADMVVETSAGGNDRILSKVSYTLGDNVETLQLTSSRALNATGNELGNRIVGNNGINILDGRGGADVLTGGGGADVFLFRRGEAAGDKVTDFSGAGAVGGDILTFTGFGSDAFLSHVDSSDMYVIHAGAAYGGITETIQIAGVTTLSDLDYIFA